MSWLSELTSKAEAMLVKLDQDAAQALQNPETLIKGAKLIDQAINSVAITYRGGTTTSDDNKSSEYKDESIEIEDGYSIADDPESQSNIQRDNSNQKNPNNEMYDNQSRSTDQSTEQRQIETRLSDKLVNRQMKTITASTIPDSDKEYVSVTELKTLRQHSSKFTIQTSNRGTRAFLTTANQNKNHDLTIIAEQNGLNQEALKRGMPVDSPRADDIRASINRSLQEYANQSLSDFKYVSSEIVGSTNQQTSHTSHFDDQPNLIRYYPLFDSNQDADILKLNRADSSSSFSIDLPENYQIDNDVSNDLTTRLLKQGALRKKSTFYIHKVMNRLANSNGQTSPMFSDRTKITVRQIQLRMASFARRLNNHFRTHPMMKYVMLAYLVLMQLLVVYVLFFYQSSSSATDLSSQIKQQEELIDLQLNSEMKPNARS